MQLFGKHTMSEKDLQAELDNSRVRSIGHPSKIAIAMITIRSREVGVVRNVEEFGAELGFYFLVNRRYLA
jgi:hypothetical protein